MPRVALGVENSLASSKSVVIHGLERPFTNKHRECALLSNVLGLSADCRVDVFGICTGSGEVVYVRIKHNVVGSVVEWNPVRGTLETILDHHGNTAINLGNFLQNTVHVSVDPVGAICSQTGISTESDKVGIRCLVDRGDSERINVTRRFNKVEHCINGLERVVEVSAVEEPGVMTKRLANIKRIDTSWEGMKTNDTMHVVLRDGVVGDGFEIDLLIAVVKL